MELSKEQEHLVLDNQPLVYYHVQNLGVAPNSPEYEDIASIGKIGLVKAAIGFDISKDIKFATYASMCIKNEIFMHYRKDKKHANDISIDEPICIDKDGSELTLADKLEDPDSNFVEELCVKDDFVRVINIVLNYLKGKERIIFLCYIGDVIQSETAKMFNLSQSYISRIVLKSKNTITQAFFQKIHYKEVFSMTFVEDEYRISFSSKDITKFNKIFATLLQNLQSTKNLPSFRVNCNNERIIVQIPAEPQSFSFIAQIIQEIDNFSMTFVADKSVTFQDIDNEQKSKTNCITNGLEKQAQQKSTIQDDKKQSAKEKCSMSKQIREYICTLDSFSFKQIKEHFPDISDGNIGNAIWFAKKKGLITVKSRGEYVVNKK